MREPEGGVTHTPEHLQQQSGEAESSVAVRKLVLSGIARQEDPGWRASGQEYPGATLCTGAVLSLCTPCNLYFGVFPPPLLS